MAGDHSLTSSNVDSHVDNRIGVYKLYNSREGPLRYVGMSKNLNERLKDHVGDYSHFEHEYQPNETEAYERQARIYHHHGGTDDLDNGTHPQRPHRQVVCPVCSVHE